MTRRAQQAHGAGVPGLLMRVPWQRDAGLLDWARLVLAVSAFGAAAWTGVPRLQAGCA